MRLIIEARFADEESDPVNDGDGVLAVVVQKEATLAGAQLDQFLSRNGVGIDERVTLISDDAGEFDKAVQGSQLARGRILDWFHFAMKFKAAQRSVFGSKMIGSLERESVETEIEHAKWLVGHGKGSKAVERIKALDAQLLTRQGLRISHQAGQGFRGKLDRLFTVCVSGTRRGAPRR
jgi:hypothetical protein